MPLLPQPQDHARAMAKPAENRPVISRILSANRGSFRRRRARARPGRTRRRILIKFLHPSPRLQNVGGGGCKTASIPPCEKFSPRRNLGKQPGSQGATDEDAVKLRARLPRGAEQDGRDAAGEAAVRGRALRAAQRIRAPAGRDTADQALALRTVRQTLRTS